MLVFSISIMALSKSWQNLATFILMGLAALASSSSFLFLALSLAIFFMYISKLSISRKGEEEPLSVLAI